MCERDLKPPSHPSDDCGGDESGDHCFVDEAGSDDSEYPLDDPLRFNPRDTSYRIWCNCRVLQTFFLIGGAQMLICALVIVGTLAHINSVGTDLDGLITGEDNSSGLVEEEGGFEGAESLFTDGARLFFEPLQGLVYARLTVATCEIAALCVGFYGVWRQKSAVMLAPLLGAVAVIVTVFAYFVLLTWYCVAREDYFAFCFVGLTLLFLLLINVLGLHSVRELRVYLEDLERFLVYAKRRWPDVERRATVVDNRRQPTSRAGNGSIMGAGASAKTPRKRPSFFMRYYRVSRALVAQARLERNRFRNGDCGSTTENDAHERSERQRNGHAIMAGDRSASILNTIEEHETCHPI